MKNPTEPASKPLRGVAALFDEFERKELFHKYLFFLGWVEIAIFAICWLYQLGDRGYDRFGPIEIPFPWRVYFLVSFLAPIVITFLLGIVVVGFNRYFAEEEPVEQRGSILPESNGSGRIHKLRSLVDWLQHLPYLSLLLLLGLSVGVVYKIDAILAFITSVGDKSVRIVLISIAVVVGLAAIFALILIVLNFQLRKRSMAYQYKKDVAERFGLVILEDNTVLDRNGRLLVQGRKWKDMVPLLPADTSQSTGQEHSGSTLPRPADAEVS